MRGICRIVYTPFNVSIYVTSRRAEIRIQTSPGDDATCKLERIYVGRAPFIICVLLGARGNEHIPALLQEPRTSRERWYCKYK